MNNLFRTTVAGLSLLALAAVANAQTTVFSNDGQSTPGPLGTGRAALSYAANNGTGVGFSNSGDPFATFFMNSPSAQTAQSVFQPFVFNGPSQIANTLITVGLHGTAFNEVAPGTAPVTLFVSIFANGTSSGAPAPGVLVLNNAAVSFIPNGTNADQYSQSATPIALASMLTSGGSYVLVIAPSATPNANNSATQPVANAGVVDSVQNPGGNNSNYVVDNDSANTATSGFTTNFTNGPVAFRLINAAQAAPEPSQVASLGLGMMGLAGLAWKRRRSA